MTEKVSNNISNSEANVSQQEQAHEQASQPKTSYAVRPDHRHHRRIAYSDQNNMLKVRNWLNIGFMLLAIIGVVIWTQLDDMRTLATGVLITAVVLKIAEVCIRLFKK